MNPSPLRVGYVLKKYPRLSETFILNEILELERQGVEVTVFSVHRPDDTRFHPGVSQVRGEIVYLPDKEIATPAFLKTHETYLRERKDALFSIFERLLIEAPKDMLGRMRWSLAVALEAERRGLHHLHAHFATVATDVAAGASSLSKIPFSFTAHAKDIYRETVSPHRFRSLAENAAFLITVCHANERHIRDRLLGDGAASLRVLYNGIDLDLFEPSSPPPSDVPRIVGVGRLVPKKGFVDLVRAAAGLRERGVVCDVRIIGDGEERSRLEATIEELSADNVTLVGPLGQDEVRNELCRSKIFALPCTIDADGNRDALPTVLLEALGAGIPVVSTPVTGIEEILDYGRAGRLVPRDDPRALENALAELLDDPDACRTYSLRGRSHALTHFDLKKNVAQLKKNFEESALSSVMS